MASQTDQDPNNLDVHTLKSILRKHTLPTTGNKMMLIRRVIEHRISINNQTVDDTLTEADIEDIMNNIHPSLRNFVKQMLNSIEDTINIIFDERGNFGSSKDLYQLLKVLRTNTFIKHLTIDNFIIDKKCATSIRHLLQKNRLISLTCRRCDDIDGQSYIYHIFEELVHNNTLLSLTLDTCNISTRTINELCNNLYHNRTLKTLNIIGDIIGDPLHNIFVLLTHNHTINTLNVYNNDLGYIFNTKDIMQCIAYATSLTDLNIGFNCFNDNGIFELALALQKNKSIVSLNISENIYTDQTFSELLIALSNRHMRLLDVSSYSGLSIKNIDDLSRTFANSSSLHTLILRRHDNDNDHPEKMNRLFNNLLAINTSIHTLNISGNLMQADSMKNLYHALIQNKNIVNLDVTCNTEMTGNEGDQYIVELLKAQFLKQLYIRNMTNNRLLEDIGSILKMTNSESNPLEILNIYGNNAPAGVTRSFFECLFTNDTLLQLNIDNCNLLDSGELLCDILKKNESLRVLTMINSNFNNDVLQLVFEGLAHNTTLLGLHLSTDNDIDKNLMQQVTNLINRNNSIHAHHIHMSKSLWTTLIDELL